MAIHTRARIGSVALASLVLAGGCMSSEGTGKADLGGGVGDGSAAGAGSGVTNALAMTKLVSDQAGVAPHLGADLVNAWGLIAHDGMFWIADAGTGKVSIYDGTGAAATGKLASVALDLGEGITGIAENTAPSLQVHTADACVPAQLIFASEHGTLIGVSLELSMTKGFTVVDRSGSDAVYKGVAVVAGATGPLVLAADFHNARIDVFDANYGLVSKPAFVDPGIPAGFAPFNVMAFAGTVYVTYAQQDDAKEDEIAGPGLGYVAAFDASGTLLWEARSQSLNAPWGMALAHDFAAFPGALLVGNFGDGHITAIDPATGKVLGQLVDKAGAPTAIEGLWGIAFGTGVAGASAGGLYFAAGPDDEAHGLFGLLSPAK